MIVAVMALPRPVVGCARPISGGAGWFDTIEPTAPLMSRATEIALSLNHPAYDCFYLATAELHDDHVVTADLRFLHKLRGSQWAATALSLEDWAHWKGLG